MKLLVLGANGQVGFELQRSLSALGEVVAADRSTVDLARPETIARTIEAVRPAWVINAAAYTAVDRAESETELANRINGEAVGEIGRAAANVGAAVLHYSTDYVFDGNATAPIAEDAPTNPVNAYGRSKLLGEQLLAAANPRHVIFRTAWVYASRGSNFLRTMLKLASRERLTVVADQRGAPTTARWLAEASALAIARGDAFGTFHATMAGEATWHAFAEAIFHEARALGLIEKGPEVAAIPSSDYPTPAKRPSYSVLGGERLEGTFGIHRPHWRAGLGHVLSEMAR